MGNDHVVLDKDRFISYDHPLPTTYLAESKRYRVRKHLRASRHYRPGFLPRCADIVERMYVCNQEQPITEKPEITPPSTTTHAITTPTITPPATATPEPPAPTLTERVTRALDNVDRLEAKIKSSNNSEYRGILQRALEQQYQEMA